MTTHALESRPSDMLRDCTKKRASIKGRLTKFKKYIDSFENEVLSLNQRSEIKLRLSAVVNLYSEYNSVQIKIEELLSESELDNQLDIRSEFENDYYSVLAQAQALVKDVEVVNERSVHSAQQSVKLPTISLPTFDGSYEHWLEFRDTYLSLVHNSREITSIQKFHYLKSSLKGSAELVIDSLEFSAQNYDIAWELLLNRYNNNRLLIHNHVKALFSIQSVSKESPTLIRKLIDTVLKNLRALKLLGEPTDTWDTLIIYIIVSKLDMTTEREWEQRKGSLMSRSSDTKIKLDDLLSFLRERADVLETLTVTHSRNNNTYDSKRYSNTPNTKNTFNNNKVHCHVGTEKSHNKTPFKKQYNFCPMCSGNHNLYACQAFLDINIHDKLKLVREKNLCENCLRLGHSADVCRYGPCRRCNKKHNSIIHRDENENIINSCAGPSGLGNNAPTEQRAYGSNSHASHVHVVGNITADSAHSDSYAQSTEMRPVLLSTALIRIADNLGIYHIVRALLDCGSERCIITQSLCDKLNTQSIQSTQQIKGVGGSVSQCTKLCDIEFKSIIGTYHTRAKCLVLPHITSSLPAVAIRSELLSIPDGVILADPEFHQSQPIDVLIGADIFWDLIKDGRIRLNNGPILQNTQLGWIISGPIHYKGNNKNNKHVRCNFMQSIDMEASLDVQLRKFWELEDLPSRHRVNESRSEDERICEELFVQTTKRLADGRFCVRMPFKISPNVLGDTRKQAEQRFYALEKRLQHNPHLKQLYIDFIKEYCELGHMERIDKYTSPHYFMPHHGVFRENAITTRLRVVFDASASSSSGYSLNDLQLVGPPIQGDLLSILLRFRENRYVACSDVQKMFRQVLVDEQQQDLQLIVWRDDPNDALKVFKLKTVTYGTASAPYLSCRCIKQLAQECSDPEVANIISQDFYVDDLICGHSNKERLKEICINICKVLQSGCFPLRKWIFNFNFAEFNEYIDTTKELSLGDNIQHKTLGLGWHNGSDELCYHSKFDNSYTKTITKRIILSCSSQIFDPLGLLSPIVIIAKVLLQKLWLLKLNWDEPVPCDIAQIWIRFVNNLVNLQNVRIPRYVVGDNPSRLELHIFTDSSLTAYGACAYVRTINTDNEVCVRLLCAKGKVAPTKPTSIPRLELCGALVGARLYTKIINSLRSSFNRVVFWTDSTIVLGWLRMSPNLLKPFVQNRTTEIHELTSTASWRHVKGEHNPADLISRGRSLDDLWTTTLWWEGPEFLQDVNNNFNLETYENVDLPEVKSNIRSLTLTVDQGFENIWFPFQRFSQYNRMKRTMAYLLRFVYNARNKPSKRRTGAFEVFEINEAELVLARLSQYESYRDVYDCLSKKQLIKSKHASLNKLNLFLDESNILRVGGRLENYSEFSFDKKHPILISSKHHFTLLLFRYEHRRLLHAPPQALVFALRESWWPVRARDLARKVVHECVMCKRMRGQTLTPIMGNLPQERLQPGYPFLYCGVDYAGPVLILNRKGRGAKSIKSYICLFVCFVTRAIHLELVSDLTSEAYLLSLKRFISRRGKPAEIFSDNGKNFVGLMNDFSKFLSSIAGEIKDYALSQNIKFRMNPPYASHFGGLWEAGVKSCKHHLKRVIGNARLTFEELSTVLTQIEAVLNSRPLSPMSSDPRDLLPLSPAHFLIGRPLTAPVCADLHDVPDHRLTRYERIEKIRQHFWTRWSREYVSELQTRSKWRLQTEDLKENTLVVIKEDNLPPLKWCLGRIIKTYPGKDGVSRVADIKTATTIVRRAFSKICPLIDTEQSS